MKQFTKEISIKTPKEELQDIIRVHKMNLDDLKATIKMMDNGELLLGGSIKTLESDIEILKHIEKKIL